MRKRLRISVAPCYGLGMPKLRDTGGTGRSRATVASLSRVAGVSASTVSRALNGDTRISSVTRRRIAALAEQAGYTPDAVARTLSSGRSGVVGLVLGELQNPFYVELLEEAFAEAARRGVRLLLLHIGSGPVEERTAEALLQHRLDGALISSAELSSRAADICASNGVPVVMVNRVPRRHSSAVSCDNADGGRQLAELLLSAGHRRFGVVRGTRGTSTSTDRERGFEVALQSAGAEIALRMEGLSRYDGGFEAGLRMADLPAGERPDAIFAINDVMAMGVLDALRIRGLRVPQDASVVGFDNVVLSAHPAYGLTTVAQPLQAMVRRGLDLLLERVAAPDRPDETVLLRGELIVRGSSKPVVAYPAVSHAGA